MTSVDQAIAFATSQLGVRYVYGGSSTSGWDCSGLMQASCKAGGVSIPRTAAGQQAAGPLVSLNMLQPGDLCFTGNPASHVVMYLGGGNIIDAPHTGSVVMYDKLTSFSVTNATRPLTGGATATTVSFLNLPPWVAGGGPAVGPTITGGVVTASNALETLAKFINWITDPNVLKNLVFVIGGFVGIILGFVFIVEDKPGGRIGPATQRTQKIAKNVVATKVALAEAVA